jgi:uncharacterized protein (DUF4415 family)
MKTQELTAFSDIESWEERALGADMEFAEAREMPKGLQNQINQSHNMQLISIRLPHDLIDDLKLIGKEQNLGYQALTREVLKRFVAAEKKLMFVNLMKERERLEKQIRAYEEQIKSHSRVKKTA